MMVTNDATVAEKVRMLRNYGQREKYQHLFLAYNRRLDTLQAAVLRVKLRHLDAWNGGRQRVARQYDQLLGPIEGITVPAVAANRGHVYHLYVILHPERTGLMNHLKTQGVMCGLHYPTPVHLQPCYRDLKIVRGSLPITEQLAERVLSLPMFPEMTSEQLDYVSGAIAGYQRTNSATVAS
jgi:dTDP-4-amino-4,6-dideoxygalactose transaminase